MPTALDRAIAWKLKFIKEIRAVIIKDPTLKDRLKELDEEEKILSGKDKAHAWRVAKANLERWIIASKLLLKGLTYDKAREDVKRDIKERERLRDDLIEEGEPK